VNFFTHTNDVALTVDGKLDGVS